MSNHDTAFIQLQYTSNQDNALVRLYYTLRCDENFKYASSVYAFRSHSKKKKSAWGRLDIQKNLQLKLRQLPRGAMVLKSELKRAGTKNILDVVFLFLFWTNDSTVLSHTRLWLEQIDLLINWLVWVHFSSSFDMLPLRGQIACYAKHFQDTHDA